MEKTTVLHYKNELEGRLENYIQFIFSDELASRDMSMIKRKALMTQISEIKQKLRDINSMPISELDNTVLFYKTTKKSKM